MKKYLLLGYGYSAQYIEKHLQKISSVEVFKTSRTEKKFLHFDLNEPSSWDNIPKVDGTFWMFPARPGRLVDRFLDEKKDILGKIVVLGSTRAFLTSTDHQVVSEKSPVDLQIDRVGGEESIRRNNGLILYAAGIYGIGRNPLNWVQKGWVFPQKKYLNAIHVEDLAQLSVAAMTIGEIGERYIAADGSPLFWDELIERWSAQYGVKPSLEVSKNSKKSKKVNPAWTLGQLKVNLIYPNVYAGVSDIESTVQSL